MNRPLNNYRSRRIHVVGITSILLKGAWGPIGDFLSGFQITY